MGRGLSAAVMLMVAVLAFSTTPTRVQAQSLTPGQRLPKSSAVDAGDNRPQAVSPYQAIAHGEFSLAAVAAETVPTAEADEIWSALSHAQLQSGNARGSWASANRIQSNRQFMETTGTLFQGMRDAPSGNGNGGGITLQDFQPLINLIQSTVAPDSWATTQGEGTIQPYVTGVFIDAAGVLHRFVPDSTGRLDRLRDRIGERDAPHYVPESELRKVSLVQLERQARWYAAQGKPLPEDFLNLGGIHDLRYLIVLPEQGDLLIAGPAGPWHRNAEGIAVNTRTGEPVLQLDDLVNCLRSVWYEGGRFGCAITPREENLKATQAFLSNSKLVGQAWRSALQDTVGLQDIEVFGMDAETTTARILVEADYRMKLLGMGIEPSIPEVPSYLDHARKTLGNGPMPMDVARWWFTLDYRGIAANPDRSVFELLGSGVKVLSETEMLDRQGRRIHTGQAVGPTKQFADDFTDHFEELAADRPIFLELRNVFDLAMVFSIIKRERLDEAVGWEVSYFGRGDEDTPGPIYAPRRDHLAQVVPSVMNHVEVTVRQGKKRIRHQLVGVSGGIDCPVQDEVNGTVYQPLAPNAPEVGDRDSADGVRRPVWWD